MKKIKLPIPISGLLSYFRTNTISFFLHRCNSVLGFMRRNRSKRIFLGFSYEAYYQKNVLVGDALLKLNDDLHERVVLLVSFMKDHNMSPKSIVSLFHFLFSCLNKQLTGPQLKDEVENFCVCSSINIKIGEVVGHVVQIDMIAFKLGVRRDILIELVVFKWKTKYQDLSHGDNIKYLRVCYYVHG